MEIIPDPAASSDDDYQDTEGDDFYLTAESNTPKKKRYFNRKSVSRGTRLPSDRQANMRNHDTTQKRQLNGLSSSSSVESNTKVSPAKLRENGHRRNASLTETAALRLREAAGRVGRFISGKCNLV